jgi:hypothetical protein
VAREWNIRSRGHACAACGKNFEDKRVCVSLLLEAAGEFARNDYCAACWRGLRDQPREGVVSVWEGVYEAPVRNVKPEVVTRETADALFRRLVILEDPETQPVVYVLAVMLERAKRLVERGRRDHESGGILRVYEDKATGDSFVVVDPRLRMDQIAKVQEDVAAQLGETAQ